MKTILVVFDDFNILAWLTSEPVESAQQHIENGYPEHLDRWLLGELTAMNVEVPLAEEFMPELFEVVGGVVQRKP